MSVITAKQIAREAIEQLPESATVQDVIEEIRILAAIRDGEAAADAGRVTPHDEVAKLLPTWSSK